MMSEQNTTITYYDAYLYFLRGIYITLYVMVVFYSDKSSVQTSNAVKHAANPVPVTQQSFFVSSPPPLRSLMAVFFK